MFNPVTTYQTRQRYLKIFRAVGLLLLVTSLGACDLDTSAIPDPHTSALPAYVCPGDSATLSWDLTPSCDDGSCGDVTVNIASSSSALPGASFTSLDDTGSTTSGPITGLTTFTFDGTIDRHAFGPYDHNVDVLLPDRTTDVLLPDAVFACPGWDPNPISLAVGEFRPENTQVVRIGNFTSCRVFTNLETTLGSFSFTLEPFMYTEIPPDLQNKVLGITILNIGGDCVLDARRPDCTTGADWWPDILLSAELTCDLSSASEAIVAGTPEAEDTPQDTFIVTNTPPPTPRITTMRDANCRLGPHDVFDIATVLNEGFQAEVNGRDWQSTWWRILTPDGLSFCWISDSVVEYEGTEGDVAVIESPPTPAIGCLIYDESTPNNLTDTTCVPRSCTNQDQPGTSCTPE